MHGKALSRILAAVVLAAVLTASLGLVSAQAQSDPVVMAYGARSINFFPTWLAQRGGFFEKYGVNVQLTELLGGPAMQALSSGSLQVYDGGVSAMAARAQGMPAVIISQGAPNNFALYGSADVKDVADLRGRVVAVDAPGTTQEYTLKQLLDHFGVPYSDLRVTFTQNPPAVYTALQAGHAAAGIFSPPTSLRAEDAGYKALADVYELGLPGVGSTMIVNERWAANNRETVKNILKAYTEAVRFAQQSTPDEMAQLLSEFYGIDDLELMRRTAERFIPRYFPVPRVWEEAIVTMAVAMELDPDPSLYYDPSYIEELEQEGFFRSLGVE